MSEWISQGWVEAENQAKQYGSFTREFFLKSGDEAIIRVLDDAPVNIRDHFIKGENKWVTCTGDTSCPICATGNKAQNHFIFQVIDKREYVSPKDGKTYKDQVKLWRVGIKLLRLLKLKSNKAGPLSTYDIEVSKLGEGQQVSYNIDVVISTLNTPPEIPEGQEKYNLEEVLAPPTGKVFASSDDDTMSESRIPWDDGEDTDD
jgi:hypothetical protein